MEKDKMPPILTVENVKRRFGRIQAVAETSFVIHKGEIVALVGVNGSGKSTLLRILAGLCALDAGKVCLSAYKVPQSPLKSLKVLSFVGEGCALWEELTVEEYLQHMGGMYNIKNASKLIEMLAEKLGLTSFMHAVIAPLSKGQKQRVLLAGALIHDPKLLLLDEPTDGLDPNQRIELYQLFRDMAPEKAILFTTHALEEAVKVATRILVMHRGKIILDTTPNELIRQGKGDVMRAFKVMTKNRGKV